LFLLPVLLSNQIQTHESPRNRKQRRAAAVPADSFDPSSIPLARPPVDASRTKQQAKTLLEIAAERQKELQTLVDSNGRGSAASTLLNPESTQTQFLQVSPSGEVSRFNPSGQQSESTSQQSDAPLPPVIDTLLL
jgi:hypothetical protein